MSSMSSSSTATDVDFYFDPSCPWTWLTSRWLVEAAAQRDLAIAWRPLSLHLKSGDDSPEPYRTAHARSHRALRVIVRILDEHGNDAAGRFYAERSYRHFGLDGDPDPDLGAVLEAVGLPSDLLTAADDDSLDAALEASNEQGEALAGADVGSPLVSLHGCGRAFFGPVLTELPPGEQAGLLWDHFAGLLAIDGFHELKRDRSGGPSTPARPAA